MLLDPRHGDFEDNAASPEQRSLFAIVGSLLVEISPAKLLFAWTISILLPGVLLGLAPLVASVWISSLLLCHLASRCFLGGAICRFR